MRCGICMQVYRLSDGMIALVAGVPGQPGHNGTSGRPTSLLLDSPQGIACDRDSKIYFADRGNHIVYVIFPNNTMSLLAGVPGTAGSGGNGPALSVSLNAPMGIAVSPSGYEIYITEQEGNRLRRLDLSPMFLNTVAGGAYV